MSKRERLFLKRHPDAKATTVNRISLTAFCLSLAAVACLLPASAFAGPIQWVIVGDPGNTADTAPSGYGAVATSFQIMKYEFTNQQYTDFLNSVDRNGTNPYSVYNAEMGSGARGGISLTTGASSGSKYAVKTNMGDKPVNFVSWFDAARVSNWLMNGATSSSSTETGAYTLNGATTGIAPAVNNGATFYIPTEDQWYKAAYYKGGGTNAGYWNYATQSDTAPRAVSATTVGSGTFGGVSPVTSGTCANFNQKADWNSQDGNVTTVGTNGGASAYGAFDMSGNLGEWNDLTGAAGTSRQTRGGHWSSDGSLGLSSPERESRAPSFGSNAVGFRLASPVSSPSAVPEIDPNSLGSVLALVLGSLGLLERRRLFPCKPEAQARGIRVAFP
jgi:formylglycine-generating enzyme